MIRILDYLFILRPTLFAPVWVFLVIGYLKAGGRCFLITKNFVVAFVLYTLLMGVVYIINQIEDMESDRINKKLFILSEGHMPVRHAWMEAILLLLVVCLLTIQYSLIFKLFVIFSFVAGILYSVSPFKFKGRPILDLLSNSFGYGFLNFSVGWLTVQEFSFRTFIYSLPYIFAVGAVFTNTTIPDIEGDRKTREITTGVFLGKECSLVLSTVLISISLVLSIILRDRICLIATVVSLPLFVYALIKKDLKAIFISIRVGGTILAIIVGCLWPYLFILLGFVFISLRIYYKKRFGIVYPKIA